MSALRKTARVYIRGASITPRERSLRDRELTYERMPARLRVRQRMTTCRFATANVSARQADSRGSACAALRAGRGRDFKRPVSLL
jgi:hypothetical protein